MLSIGSGIIYRQFFIQSRGNVSVLCGKSSSFSMSDCILVAYLQKAKKANKQINKQLRRISQHLDDSEQMSVPFETVTESVIPSPAYSGCH